MKDALQKHLHELVEIKRQLNIIIDYNNTKPVKCAGRLTFDTDAVSDRDLFIEFYLKPLSEHRELLGYTPELF